MIVGECEEEKRGGGRKGLEEPHNVIFYFKKILRVVALRQRLHVAPHVVCLCGRLTTT